MHRKILLPRGWNRRTKAAILQILALGHYAFTGMLARAANEQRPVRTPTAHQSRRVDVSFPIGLGLLLDFLRQMQLGSPSRPARLP